MVDSDAITLRELIELCWREKWLIIGLTFGVALAAAFLTKTQTRIFKATVVISAVQNTGGMGRFANSAAGSQIGGLASLIGINIGADTSKAESLAVLQSEALTERYVQDNNLMPLLFPQYWDAKNKKWLMPEKPSRRPTLWKANRLFKKYRTVTEDKKTQLTNMTIEWTDPQTAATWANGLVAAANDFLRKKAIAESEEHIAYLNEEAAKTDVAQVRAAIYAVLESEIKNVMLAKGPGDYALKVIDPAFPPEQRSSPILIVWVLVGGFIGFVLSMIIIFFRRAWNAAEP